MIIMSWFFLVKQNNSAQLVQSSPVLEQILLASRKLLGLKTTPVWAVSFGHQNRNGQITLHSVMWLRSDAFCLFHFQVLLSTVSTGEKDIRCQIQRPGHLHLGACGGSQCPCVRCKQCDGCLRHLFLFWQPIAWTSGLHDHVQRHHTHFTTSSGVSSHGTNPPRTKHQPEEESDHCGAAHPTEQHFHPVCVSARGWTSRHSVVHRSSLRGVQHSLRRSGHIPFSAGGRKSLVLVTADCRVAAEGLPPH